MAAVRLLARRRQSERAERRGPTGCIGVRRRPIGAPPRTNFTLRLWASDEAPLRRESARAADEPDSRSRPAQHSCLLRPGAVRRRACGRPVRSTQEVILAPQTGSAFSGRPLLARARSTARGWQSLLFHKG